MNRQGNDGQQGLTLVEVMMALTIFSIGILAVAGMQGISLKTMGMADRGTRQSVSAAGHIEYLLSIPYDDTRLADTDIGYEPATPDHGPFPMMGSTATIEWEVEDDFPVSDTKRIVVTVRPNGKRGPATLPTFEYVKARDY
jgi:type IV pilus assembly protein PilV